MRRVRSSWAVLVITQGALLGASHRLAAQQADTVRTATLAGIVRDSTGAPIADADVVLSVLKLGAHTDVQGWFTLDGVPPGEYTMHVQRLGYAWVEFRWPARAGQRTEIGRASCRE